MKSYINKTYNDIEDLVIQVYKIQNISNTIFDALENCRDNFKDSGHIISVCEVLNFEIEKLINQSDLLNSEILHLKMINK